MNVNGRPTRTIWPASDGQSVEIIDQTLLPHRYEIATLRSLDDAAHAIKAMLVRGAPLIGATAAYGFWLGMRQDPSDLGVTHTHQTLLVTRPTAVNLRWALDRLRVALAPLTPTERADAASALAAEICDEDVSINHAIGQAGPAVDPGNCRDQTPRPTRQHPHSLQCGLAGHRRLGDGHVTDLSGSRRRHSSACVGRRNPTSQPGLQSHRLGTP